jgi:hypothetical protein
MSWSRPIRVNLAPEIVSRILDDVRHNRRPLANSRSSSNCGSFVLVHRAHSDIKYGLHFTSPVRSSPREVHGFVQGKRTFTERRRLCPLCRTLGARSRLDPSSLRQEKKPSRMLPLAGA